MKQFNLEKYLENPNRKVVTRDGRSVRIICTNRLDEGFPVIALINNEDSELCFSYTTFGKSCIDLDRDYKLDLFFAPEKREGWTNVYEEGTNRYLDGCICSTEEEAKKIRGCGYITTIKIEWEE